jgi:nucleoside-diphosphate-sugar epimerase
MSIAFVTGVTSFHGGHIARELVKEGYEVHGLLRHVANRDFKIEGVTMHKGDVRDYETTSAIVHDIEPNIVVHLAAQSPVEYSFTHEKEIMDTNYLGTYNMAKSCMVNPELTKFILASSIETYGNQPTLPLQEYMSPNPASPYGVSKVCAETYVRYLSRGYKFPGVMLRQLTRMVVTRTITS